MEDARMEYAKPWRAPPPRQANTGLAGGPGALALDSRGRLSLRVSRAIESVLPDVIRYARVQPSCQRLALGRGRPNRGRGGALVDAFKQVQGHAGKNEITFCGLLMKRTSHRRRRPQTFRQRLGHVPQRISRAAGHDEIAFSEKRARLAPFCDVAEGVHSDQEKKAVGFLEGLFQASNGVDGIVRGCGASPRWTAGGGCPYAAEGGRPYVGG